MRKVLVVAYFFPPCGGGGVQRTLKFVKYLPEFGWQPVVLTVEPQTVHIQDSSLETEIPSHIPVHRTKALLLPAWFPWRLRKFVSQWLMMVDQQLGWLPFAVRRGREIIRQEGIEAIYSTSAPNTAHLIGGRLAKTTNLPWLADFRDPWIGNFSNRFPTTFHERVARRLERHVVESADQVIVVSEPMRQALLDRHKALFSDQVLTLPNGYDLADFDGNETLGQENDRLVFVHSGSFYGPQTPSHFLQGLRNAIENDLVPRQGIRVHFVGNIGQSVKSQVHELGLAEVVQISGYLPHRQSISYLRGADVLLLIIGSGPGSEAVYTGKIFEYLIAGRSIMALVPPGVAADLIHEARAGAVIAPTDVAAITCHIDSLYRRWQAGELKDASDRDAIAHYDRRRLTARLAETLNKACSGKVKSA